MLTFPLISIPPAAVLDTSRDEPVEVIVPVVSTSNLPFVLVNSALPVLFVTVPPTKSPSLPVSLVAISVPALDTLPFKASFVPEPLFVNVILPLFLTTPDVSTRSCPAEFSTVRLPLGFKTSPAMLIPDAPVFVIVMSPLPKFLTLPVLPTEVPVFEVITILPLALANSLPVFMLSVLTRFLNNSCAAVSLVNTSVLPPTPAAISPFTPTCPPCKLTSPRAITPPPLSIVIGPPPKVNVLPSPACNVEVLNVLSVSIAIGFV